ncbi:MAG: InlB B-repeat-containing protein, partial [Lachnospiraceae bacterium]|nr:InlB B-repeat-containing protein [Lachnospiraceae bacterium]
SGEMANVTVIEGNTFALPECSFTAPAKHEFDKWTLGEPGANVTITGNTTITALWKQLPPEVYTVSFDANGGSGSMDNATVTEGEAYSLPECAFTKEGYEFETWDRGMPGANVTITGNTTIIAQWRIQKDNSTSEIVVNETVTLLNITDVSNRVIHSNTSNAVFRIDENISCFMGAIIGTNLTVRLENATSNGVTVFDLKTLNDTRINYLVNNTFLEKQGNSIQNLCFDSSSSSVVGAFIYNNESNNNESDFYYKWRKRELPSDNFRTDVGFNSTVGFNSANMNITFLNNFQARVYSGSTVVELTGEYLRTLEPGIYAIYFEFENGRAATLFAVENSTSVTPPPEEENGTGSGSGNETENNTGSGSGNETENNTGSGSGNETENNTGSGSGNETGTESGTGNETETGNNTDSGNTGNERGENNAADTGSAGVIIYLMVAALLAGCVMSLSKGKKRRR